MTSVHRRHSCRLSTPLLEIVAVVGQAHSHSSYVGPYRGRSAASSSRVVVPVLAIAR
jgi:hypothetical protein